MREIKGNFKRKALLIAIGAAVGAANGLFGGGGGMIVVPALIYLFGMEVKSAHATAILIILPISLVSAAVYVFNGSFELSVLIPCALGVTLGGVIGAVALKNSPPYLVSLIFAAVMLFTGIKMAL